MAMKERTDLELVKQCLKEYPHTSISFEALLRRHEPVVLRFCVHYLHHSQDAEDAAQETFVRAFFHLNQFEGRASFKTWLLRIARNCCASQYARRSHDAAPGGAGEYSGYGRRIEPVEIPEIARAPSQEEALASIVMKRLPEAERQVLLLRHVSELSLREVAEVLEISLSAAKMRVYRAEERFREEFGRAREQFVTGNAIVMTIIFLLRNVTFSLLPRI